MVERDAGDRVGCKDAGDRVGCKDTGGNKDLLVVVEDEGKWWRVRGQGKGKSMLV